MELIEGAAEDIIPTLQNRSVNLVVTSPPYGLQRKNTYGGVPEAGYPEWFAGIMQKLEPKMAPDGSVFINIRPNAPNGGISDYVLKTILAIRRVGWKQVDDFVWHTPDKPPTGRPDRPRRNYELVHWFALSSNPYVDLRASTNGLPYQTRDNRKTGNSWDKLERYAVTRKNKGMKITKPPRIPDVFKVSVGDIGRQDPFVKHTAMFPRGVPRFFIEHFSRRGDLVLDPFAGSCQTILVADELGRRGIGIEINAEHCDLCRGRIQEQLRATGDGSDV